jgi:hypothetical protein
MLTELVRYKLDALGFNETATNPTEEMEKSVIFWNVHKNYYRYLVKFIRYAFCVITSSGSAERAFSTLKRCFGHQQNLALEDYISISVMLQQNSPYR